MRILPEGLLLIAGAVCVCAQGRGWGQGFIGTARQGSEGAFRMEVYDQSTFDQDVGFQLAGQGQSSTRNGLGFVSQSQTDITAQRSGSAVFAKWTYQPWENFQYSFLFGIGRYSLDIPSTTVTNSLTGDQVGFSYGLGVRGTLFPETAVTPALGWDAQVMWSRYYFNEMGQGSLGTSSINDRLDLYDTHVAVEASRRFGPWEPYGGVKWLRAESHLKDLTAGPKAGGKRDTVTPFLGLKLPLYSHESAVAEISMVKGVQVNAGLELKFK